MRRRMELGEKRWKLKKNSIKEARLVRERKKIN